MIKKTVRQFSKKSKELNWIILGFVIILSYGFVLANQSIGIDDENFDFYFKNNAIVASGRWGSWLLGKVVNTYSYLPVWRDTVAIVILMTASILFLCACENVSKNKLGAMASTIICSVILSYPIIAKMFIYIDNSVETSLCILFGTLAAYVAFEAKLSRKWRLYVLVLFLLIFGCSLIENTLVYFCVEICLFSLLQKERDKFFQDILFPVMICLAAVLVTKLVGRVIADCMGMYYSDYGSGIYSSWSQIKNMTDLKNAYAEICRNFVYWFRKYFSVKLFAVSAVFWLGAAISHLCRRHVKKAVYALGIIVSSFAMYFVSACGSLPLRIFTSYFISVAGMAVYIYWLIRDGGRTRCRKAARILFMLACVFCILYQTKESNEYYQLDYKRFLRDQDVARTISYDLQKKEGITPELPVIFLGQPEQYGDIDIEREVALSTIYSNNQEGESIRIHQFFRMLGYNYLDVIDGEITIYNILERTNSQLIAEAKQEAEKMPCYPYEGYIRVFSDKIVIKLGEIN